MAEAKTTYAHLGELLHTLRTRAGVKQSQVMERLEAAQSAVYLWETPESRPEPESLQALLDMYSATDAERLMAWELRGARDS